MLGHFLTRFQVQAGDASLSETFICSTSGDWDPRLPGVGTNRYAYALNDPVNKSDPDGHSAGADTNNTNEAGLGNYTGPHGGTPQSP